MIAHRCAVLVAFSGLALAASHAMSQSEVIRFVAEIDDRPVGELSSLGYAVGNPNDLSYRRSAPLGAGAVFVAYTEEHGKELWYSDGTAEGTRLIKDIAPGKASSVSGGLVICGDRVLFNASTPEHGTELWITDGTAEGTRIVLDTMPGPLSGEPGSRVSLGNIVLVRMTDPTSGRELWRTDGTAEGTYRIKDISAGGLSTSFSVFYAAGGKAYFTATEPGSVSRFWVSDGTAEGTKSLLDVSSALLVRDEVNDINGIAVVSLSTSNAGRQVWRSDGSAVGTYVIKDFSANTTNGGANNGVVLNGRLWFTGSQDTSGFWSTDGTVEGTRFEFKPSDTGPGVVPLESVNNRLIFSTQISFRRYIGATDGTPEGTSLLYQTFSDDVNTVRAVAGGAAYITARQSTGAFEPDEIICTDGTSAGTFQLTASPANAPFLQPLADGTLLYADDLASVGHEPCAANGTPQSRRLVRDLNDGPGSSTPRVADVVNGSLVLQFVGDDDLSVWSVSLAHRSVVQLTTAQARGGTWFTSNESMIAFDAKDAVFGREAMRTDGTVIGTELLSDACAGTADGSRAVPIAGATKVYSARSCQNQNGELVVSGPNAGEVTYITLSASTSDTPFVGNGAALGDLLIFAANVNNSGFELWVSDGTQAGTKMLKSLFSGSSDGVGTQFVSDGQYVYFVGLEMSGDAVWRTDGTEAGTVRLADPRPDSSQTAGVTIRAVSNGGVLYSAADFASGTELWFANGSVDSTVFLADAAPGQASSSVRGAAASDGVFYAILANGEYGEKLWVTRGTQQTTHAVRDVNPGMITYFDVQRVLASRNGRAYFTADDGISGMELWTSDGTEPGTRLVADLWPGIAGSHPQGNAVFHNARMYFSAYTPDRGRELWSLVLCPADFDGSGLVDSDDFTAFVSAFELGSGEADFDGTGFVDTDDFTEFVHAFELGC